MKSTVSWTGTWLICMRLVFSVGFLALANDARAETSMFSSPITSCGGWTKAGEVDRMLAKQWVAGYLSALNTTFAPGEKHVDVLKGVDWNAVEGAIDKFCAENPLDPLQSAVVNIYNQLNERARHRAH